MIPGMITCVLSGSVAAFGLYLLSLCAKKTKHRHSSFHAVSQLTFPSAAVFFDAAIATKCFGVSIRCALMNSLETLLLILDHFQLSYYYQGPHAECCGITIPRLDLRIYQSTCMGSERTSLDINIHAFPSTPLVLEAS